MESCQTKSQKDPPQPNKVRQYGFQIVKLEERIAPDCRFNPNAGPWVSGGYGDRFKVGKYVGNC